MVLSLNRCYFISQFCTQVLGFMSSLRKYLSFENHISLLTPRTIVVFLLFYKTLTQHKNTNIIIIIGNIISNIVDITMLIVFIHIVNIINVVDFTKQIIVVKLSVSPDTTVSNIKDILSMVHIIIIGVCIISNVVTSYIRLQSENIGQIGQSNRWTCRVIRTFTLRGALFHLMHTLFIQICTLYIMFYDI